MKRYGNLWEKVCDRANIELAADNALKRKKITREKLRFIKNRENLLDDLQESLLKESYKFGKSKEFVQHKPKRRVLNSAPFYPDKILHHCVLNVLKTQFIKYFISDTYAGIKGRGIKKGNERLRQLLYKNRNSYFLQIDCDEFYASLDHEECKATIRRLIKCKKTLRILDAIIDSHEKGLPKGFSLSSYLANLYLSKIDRWAKETRRIKNYVRYMDDIIIIMPTKEECHKVLVEIKEELFKIKLILNDNWRIAPIDFGIDVIGYKFYEEHALLRKSIKIAMQKRARSLIKQGVDDKVFKRKMASYFGWCKHANCRNLLRVTLKDKIYLFEHNMEFKRLSELKESENWFGLSKEKRVSIKTLFDKDIVFFDYMTVNIKGEEKVVVKFAYPESPEDYMSFITRSEVMKDRLAKDKDKMPFIAQIKQIKNYTAYE